MLVLALCDEFYPLNMEIVSTCGVLSETVTWVGSSARTNWCSHALEPETSNTGRFKQVNSCFQPIKALKHPLHSFVLTAEILIKILMLNVDIGTI